MTRDTLLSFGWRQGVWVLLNVEPWPTHNCRGKVTVAFLQAPQTVTSRLSKGETCLGSAAQFLSAGSLPLLSFSWALCFKSSLYSCTWQLLTMNVEKYFHIQIFIPALGFFICIFIYQWEDKLSLIRMLASVMNQPKHQSDLRNAVISSHAPWEHHVGWDSLC